MISQVRVVDPKHDLDKGLAEPWVDPTVLGYKCWVAAKTPSTKTSAKTTDTHGSNSSKAQSVLADVVTGCFMLGDF